MGAIPYTRSKIVGKIDDKIRPGVFYREMILADRPLGYWRLEDEALSIAVNQITGGINGTYVNSPTLKQPGATSSGKDYSVKLNAASSQSIHFGNPSAFQLSTVTIECWIKTPNAGSGHRGLLTKGSAYGLFAYDNILEAFDWSGGGRRSSGVAINNDKWRHVALAFKSAVANGSVIYLDGKAVLVTTCAIGSQTDNFIAGTNGVSAQLYSGFIDEIAIYNYVLTPEQILSHYQVGLK